MEHELGISNGEFREGAKEIIDYVIKYHETLGDRQALAIQSEYLGNLLPSSPPQRGGDSCGDLLKDFDRLILRGITHAHAPTFFGNFPCAESFPSLLANMLSDGCDILSYMRGTSPAQHDHELVMMDWLAKAIELPKCFLYEGKGRGCGNIQGTASEAILMTLIAARTKIIKKKMQEDKKLTKHDVLSRLVSYTSEYAHSAVPRAALVAMVDIRKLQVDEDVSLRGQTLRRAIDEDKAAGKIPFYVCATLGTTTCCSYDNLPEIGKICNEENIWLHIDAAYAGNSFVCPEFRHRMAGVELADSFNFNPHKGLMINFECSALWVRNASDMADSLRVEEEVFLQEERDSKINYRDWVIPFGRRFRSLKLWFVFRMVGVEGMQHNIRKFVGFAKLFESYVNTDSRFEVVHPVEFGLVCIRLVHLKDDTKKNRELNEKLFKRIVDSGELLISPGQVRRLYFLRIAMAPTSCNEKAVENCWKVIQKHAGSVLIDDA